MTISVESLRSLTVLNRDEGLYGFEEHHANHHDWENGYRITSHPHNEKIHRNLF